MEVQKKCAKTKSGNLDKKESFDKIGPKTGASGENVSPPTTGLQQPQ